MTSWFYKFEGQRMGPVSALEIHILIQSRQLTPDTLVWHQGLLDWRTASGFDEFRDAVNDDTSPTVSPAPGDASSLWPAAWYPEKVWGDGEAKPYELLRAEYAYDKSRLLRALLGAIVLVVFIFPITFTSEQPGDYPGMLFAWFCAAFFSSLALAALPRLFSRKPGMTVSKVGILVPGYSPQPLPWLAVQSLERVQSAYTDSINLDLEPVVAMALRRSGFRGWLYMALHGSKTKASIPLKVLRGNPDRIFNQCSTFWAKAQEEAEPASQEIGSIAAHVRDQAVEPVIRLGQQGFTYALIAILAIVYACEMAFGIDASKDGSPSIETLFLLGATFRHSIVENHQWWRLFTAPFLHGNVVHITFNCLSLWLAGRLLERLIGWRWFAAIFSASALGGSLASIWFNAPNLVGVGASGGIVGLFVAIFAVSFRASFAPIALSLRIGAGQMLLPALLPFLSAAKDGMNIDYAGHFGGAVGGGIVALIVFFLWPRERPTPRFGWAAAAFSFIFVAIAAASLWPISQAREARLMDPFADYFTGRYQQAADGFATKAEQNSEPTPYYYLWRFLAQNRGDDRQALTDLRTATTKVDHGKWPYPVYELFFGELSPADLMAKAADSNELCEATFYSGEWYLLRGDATEAQQRFETALSSCPTTFMEYDGAKGELKRLGDGPIANLPKKPGNHGTPKQAIGDTVNAPSSLITRTISDGQGRKTSQVEIAADNSSVTTAFDAASGQTLSVSHANKAGLVTAATLYDPLNSQSWTRVEQQFDARGKRTSEVQYKDDGTRAEVTFTPAGAQLLITYYAADSVLTATSDFDTTNAKAWSQITKNYNAAARLASLVTVNDDGTRVQYNYNLADTKTWSTYEQNFDASGKLTFVDQTNNNGTHNTVTYDVDNNQTWSRYEHYKDSAGRLLNKTYVYDNGTKVVYSFDATNAAVWSIYQQNYNSTGVLAYVDQTNDNGTHYNVTYDVDNDKPWSKCEQTKNSSNQTLSQTNFNDNGTKEFTTYDVTNAQDGTTKTERYDAEGHRLAPDPLYNDGSPQPARTTGPAL